MNTNTTADRIQTRVGTLNVRQHGAGSVAVLWPSLFIDSSSWQRSNPRSLRTDGSFSSMVRAMVRAAIPVTATPTPTAQRRRWRYSTLLGSTDLSTGSVMPGADTSGSSPLPSGRIASAAW